MRNLRQWILDHLGTLIDAQGDTRGRERRRKLRRGIVSRFFVNWILARAFEAGIYPPADDAPERDWEAFFQALAEFLETILPLILRLIDAFPAE